MKPIDALTTRIEQLERDLLLLQAKVAVLTSQLRKQGIAA